MSKAVAVPYIVAIILAVVVIALIGYFIFYQGGLFWGTATEQECRGYEASYCGLWVKSAYATDKKPICKIDNQDKSCDFTEYYPRCASYTWASSVNEGECKKLLGKGLIS